MDILDRVLAPGSLVVVIGANGYIASETCEKLLRAGYGVRGTVRDIRRHHKWMHAQFDSIDSWSPKSFELVEVPDFQPEGAFDAAFTDTIEGANGVVFASPPVTFDVDASRAVDPVVRAILNALSSANRIATIERFVLVSSCRAVDTTAYERPRRLLTSQTYNLDAVQRALRSRPDDDLARASAMYDAGRTLAEMQFWAWIHAHRPRFVANTVVPELNVGRALDVENLRTDASPLGMIKRALEGQWEGLPMIAHVVDVQDTARLLVGALSMQSVANERIFAYAHHATWNDVRARVRAFRPDIVVGSDQTVAVGEERGDLGDASDAIARANEILQGMGQGGGHVNLDDSLKDFVHTYYPL